MAYSFIISVSAGSTTGNNVVTGLVDSTGGDLIVIGLASYSSPTLAPTISDSKGNTYTKLNTYTVAGDGIITLYYSEAPTVGAAHTFTATGNSDFPTLGAMVFSGSASSSTLDLQNGATGSAVTSLQTGNIAIGTNNELVVTAINLMGTVSSLAVDSGFTLQETQAYVGGQHYGLGLAYLIQTTATAENPKWTWTTARNSAADIASFKASAGGGFTAVNRRTLGPRVGSRSVY